MKTKGILTIVLTLLFILFLPLMIIEMVIKQQHGIAERLKLNFQLMLFLRDWCNIPAQK